MEESSTQNAELTQEEQAYVNQIFSELDAPNRRLAEFMRSQGRTDLQIAEFMESFG